MCPEIDSKQGSSDPDGEDGPLARVPDLRVVAVGSGAGLTGDVLSNLVTTVLVETVQRIQAVLSGGSANAAGVLDLLVRSGWLVAFTIVLFVLYQSQRNNALLGHGDISIYHSSNNHAVLGHGELDGYLRAVFRFRRPFVGGLVAAVATNVCLWVLVRLTPQFRITPPTVGQGVLLGASICAGVIAAAYIDRNQTTT